MKKISHISRTLIVLMTMFVFMNTRAMAQTTITSTATGGAWNTGGTWVGGVVPAAADLVVIANGAAVTTGGNRTCAGITITGTLGMANNNVLTVNGDVSGTGTWTAASNSRNISLTGDWSFNGTSTGTGTATFTGTNDQTITGRITTGNGVLIINKTAGTVTLGNAITMGGTSTFTLTAGTFDPSTFLLTAGTRTFAAGTLRVGASTWAGNYSGAITEPAGGTIEYYANGDQTVNNVTYAGNLTLSGSGTKTTTGVTVNGILSMEGDATASAAPTYGGAATLQYNTATARTAGAEWITTFAATGGVIIANTGEITLNAAKTFGLSIPLTINSGASLNTSATNNWALTFGGNYVNNGGTLTANASAITIANTMAAQSIGSFTTTGTVSMTKTGGTATFTGNVNGGGLTLNGNGGTLNLGLGLTHTFSGAFTRTVGTINLSSSTLNIGGTTTNTAGTFTAGTSTVNYYGAAQTIANVTYNNLTLSGSGLKTTTGATVNGILSMEGDATASAAPTYGGAATLQYNTATARTAGAEWITTFAATGGVIIANTGEITLNAAKTFGLSIPLTINSGASLNTSATNNWALTFGGNYVNNGGTLTANASAITIANTMAAQSIGSFTTTGTVSMTKTGGTATFTGNVNGGGLTLNGNGGTLNLGLGLTHTFSGAFTRTVGTINLSSSTLNIGGTTTNTAGTFTAGTSTVNYYGAAQTIANVTYNNLTLSGSGLKTTTGATVNGILSMEGDATASAAPTYGGAATLQYNTATARTAGAEWITTFAATGGVIIANTGEITLNAAKTFGLSIPLTINSGASLNTSATNNWALTFGGNYVNNGGTLTANASAITIANTMAAQSIGSFTTTGTVSMTKTGGTATFTGNVNGGGLTLNGNGGTLNLGLGLTHTFSGAFIRIIGTINLSSSTLNIGGTTTNTAGTFTAGTSTVNYYGAAQTIANVTYNNLILSGSGLKTTTGVTVNGILSMEGDATVSVSAAPTYGTAATLQYQGSSAQITSNEFLSPFTATGGIIVNKSSGGVSLNSARSISSTLTLTSGVITTTPTNLLTITNTGSITGGSSASYIYGPLAMTLPANITADGTTYLYPVGENGNYRPLELVNIRTGATGPVVMVTISGTGATTCDETTITSIASRNWYVVRNSGNFTSAYVRLTESGLIQSRVIGTSSAQAGTYSSIGGSNISSSITSSLTVTSLPAYFAIGTSLILPLYSYQAGDWDVANSWTTDASGNTRVNSRIPGAMDNVTILNGRTIYIAAGSKTINALNINAGGVLDIRSTTGHNFGFVAGQGKLMLSSNTFPDGTYTNFVSSSGGTIEFYNLNGVSISGTPTLFTYNNLIISNNTASAYTSYFNNNTNPTTYTINGNLSVKSYSTGTDTLYFGNPAGSDNLINMTVSGNFTVDARCYVKVNRFASAHTIPNPSDDGSTPYPIHTLSLYGNLTNNGSIRFTGLPSVRPLPIAYYTNTTTADGSATYGHVQVFFKGATNNSVTCNGVTDFYRFIVEKGSDRTYTLEVFSTDTLNFGLYGPNFQGNNSFNEGPNQYGYGVHYKALFIHYGTLKLNEHISILYLSYSGQDFNLIPTAGLWINGATIWTALSCGGDRWCAGALYGTLRVSAGLFSTGDAGGIVLGALGTPSIIVEGTGTLRTSQVWTAAGGSNLISYTQTGGTTIIDLQGTQHPGAMLSLGTTSVFVMRGGTLTFNNNTYFWGGTTNYNVIDIQAPAGNFEVTGGTVNFDLPGAATYTANTTVPLYDLSISRKTGSAGTTTVQWNTSCTISNDLNIGANCVLNLDQNNINLTVGHDFTLTGTYTPDATVTTTTFNGTGAQAFTYNGTITNNLRNLTLANTADVTFSGNNPIITGDLTIGHGTTLRDGGTTITVRGNIVNSGTHFLGTGSITLDLNAAQTISGDGTGIFHNLTLSKGGGTVTATANLNVTGILRLAGATNGVWNVLNIGSNNISFGADALVYSNASPGTGVAFDYRRMIQTSGLASDGGVSKTYSSSTAFVFPFGFYNTANTTYYYMPHSIQFSGATPPTTYGTVTTRPVNARHPLAQGSTNTLRCYWKTTSTDFTGIQAGSVVNIYWYDYANTNYFVDGANEATYVSAVYSSSVWTTTGGVVPGSNQVTYNTSIADGDYTAGEPTGAFGTVPTLYSIAAGGPWNVSSTWSATRTGGGGAGTPDATTLVIICNAATVTTPASASSSSLTIEAGSTLDLGSFQGHSFGSIGTSSGTLKISSTNYFPSGDWGTLLSSSGGTVEYYTSGANIIMPATVTTYKNLVLTYASTNSITLPDCNLTVYSDLTVSGSTSASVVTRTTGTSRTYTVNGNLNINSGVLEFGNGVVSTIKVLGNTSIANGSTFRAASTGTVVDNILELYRNLACAGTGTFDMYNTGRALTYFKGTAEATISNGTGTIDFYSINVDKGSDATAVLNVTSTNLTGGADPFLILTNGTFRINNSSLNITLSSATSFSIPSTACLSVQSGTVTIGGANNNGDLQLIGKLEILGGTVNIGTGGNYNNDIEYAAAGTPELVVQGGQLNVNGQIRRHTYTLSGSLNYTQTNGTVKVRGNNPATTRAVFEVLNDGSRFDVDGGTIIIVNHISTASPYDLFIEPDLSNVTGGTIQFGETTVTSDNTLFYFGSSVPLGSITLEAITGLGAVQQVYPLTLMGSLTISGASGYYNTNGLDLEIGGNLTNYNTTSSTGLNVGGFRPQVVTQTTSFLGTVDQTMTGTSSNRTNFANLEMATSGTHHLNLSSAACSITVNGELTLTSGILDDGGNAIYLLKDVCNFATHTSSTTNGGMIFIGTAIQGITGNGSGVFGNIDINNSGYGVNMTDNSTVNGRLKFTDGYLYIDNYSLTIGQTGSTTGEDGTNHIVLNGVTGDLGVTKIFPANFSSSFTFPIGDNGKYTPCTYTFASNTNPSGATINVIPMDALHPTIDPPSYPNRLKYYWQVVATGFSETYSVTHTYTYAATDITGSPDNIERYSSSNWTIPNPPGTINGSPTYTFSFSTTTLLLSGSYTIGHAYIGLPILYSVGTGGDWFTAATWNPAIVPAGHSVVIQTNDSVYFTTDGAVASSLVVDGVLDARGTVSHNIGAVSGTGKIKMSPTTSNMFAFPGGSYDGFLANSQSIVEFYGTDDGTMPLNPGNINKPYQQVLFTGSGKKFISSVDTKVNGNLIIADGSKLDNTLYNKNLIILGNWIDQNTSTAGFTAGLGTVSFNGTTAQSINMATNAMKETFYNLEINNVAGLTINTGDVDVSNQLMLTLGNIIFTSFTDNVLTITNTGTNVITGGGVNSFVNGPLRKKISNNSSFQFPVGDTISAGRKRIGYVSVSSTTSPGDQIWTARFYDKNPTTDGYPVTSLTAPLISAINNEYWNVKGPTGGSAKVSLTWDQYTGMSSDAVKRTSSVVAEWIPSTWNSEGGAVTDGGQNSGTVTSTVTLSLDDHFFTIGGKATLFTTAQTGLWGNLTTWGTTVLPGANDAVEIANGTTVTINTAGVKVEKLTVDGGGTLDVGSLALELTGNLELKSSSIWTGSGGKISMTGSGGTIFGSGTVTGTCTLEIGGNKSIDGSAILTVPSVSILSGITLTNNGSITVNSFTSGGTFINDAGGTLNFTGANMDAITLSAGVCSNTVQYSGTIAQSVKPATYCHLSFSNNGSKSLAGTSTVNGDVTINTNAPFTIGSSGVLIFTGANPVIDNVGFFINHGSVTHN